MCRICNRAHEHENPFLLIIGYDRDIYLDCRRNEKNKKLYIGKLGPTEKAQKLRLESSIPFQVESIPVGPDINEISTNLATLSQNLIPKPKLKEKFVPKEIILPVRF